MRAVAPVLMVLAAMVVMTTTAAAPPPEANVPDRRVALTFDDLPATGTTCDSAYVRDVTARLTAALGARGLPSAGLVTSGRACLTAGLLRETLAQWTAIGAVLGNHTATHPDINTTPIGAYLADVDRGQALLEAAVGRADRWFRPPLLHTGADLATKAALENHLAAEGYRWAMVTVDNQEWVYAAVYRAARQRRDAELARRTVDAYIAHLEESMAFYEALSLAVVGREIPQTLLLHANLLNADELPRVLAMLEGRGYRFIGMAEAHADPAYDRRDPYLGRQGLSWLQRWALDAGVTVPPEPREAAWVAAAFREM